MENKLVIGVVGGMGSYATLNLFERLLSAFPAEKEWDRPRIIIDNYCTMPSRVRAVLYNENREELVGMLTNSIQNLISSGATKVVLDCNTSHIFLDDVYAKHTELKKYVVNIIDSCCKDIESKGLKSVFLLATEGTIQSNVYGSYAKNYSFKIESPEEKDYKILRNFIEMVKTNEANKENCGAFFDYLNSLESHAILLGCTELPVLYLKGLEYGLRTEKTIIDPINSVLEILKEDFSSNGI